MARKHDNYIKISDMTPEEQKEFHSKGGKAAAAANKRRKALKEELLLLLSNGDIQERMSLVLIQKVLDGGRDAIQAYTTIRDTIGEKPVEKIESKVENTVINVTIEDEDKS